MCAVCVCAPYNKFHDTINYFDIIPLCWEVSRLLLCHRFVSRHNFPIACTSNIVYKSVFVCVCMSIFSIRKCLYLFVFLVLQSIVIAVSICIWVISSELVFRNINMCLFCFVTATLFFFLPHVYVFGFISFYIFFKYG